MIYLLKKRNKTHHASKAVAFNILLFNKIILKNCGIILPSPDKHKFWSNTSLLLKLVYHVSQQAWSHQNADVKKQKFSKKEKTYNLNLELGKGNNDENVSNLQSWGGGKGSAGSAVEE